jgi:hypothetical protein
MPPSQPGDGDHHDKVTWMQEEYKALRAEIIGQQETQKSLLLFGTAALASILGFVYRNDDIAQHRPEALLLVQGLAFGFAYLFLRCTLAIEKIGTYICYNHEQATDGLLWESYLRFGDHPLFNVVPLEKTPSADEVEGTLRLVGASHKNIVQRFCDVAVVSPFVFFSGVTVWLIRKASVDPWYRCTSYLLLSLLLVLLVAFVLVFVNENELGKAVRSRVPNVRLRKAGIRRLSTAEPSRGTGAA